MARVDLRYLMNACDEAIGGSDHSPENESKDDQDHTEVPPYIPRDFFRLSTVTQLDSFENNSLFWRKKSTKGNSDSSIMNPGSNSNTQLLSVVLKSQASIIGLPKTQKTCYVNARNPRSRKPENIRFFPERAGPSGKSIATLIEPASPQVSCTGRVRTMQDRDGDRRGTNLHASSEAANGEENPAEKHRNGFFDRFLSIFQMGRRRQPEPEEELRNTPAPPPVQWPPRKSKDNAAPSLGRVSRFASGRKSDSWEI